MYIEFKVDGKLHHGCVEDKYREVSSVYSGNYDKYLVRENETNKAFRINPDKVEKVYLSVVSMKKDYKKHNPDN